MAKTLYQKVFEAHVVHEAAGETPIIYIDRHLVHEVTSPQAFDGLREKGRKVRRTDRTWATMDHNVSTTTNDINASGEMARVQMETLMQNAKDFGVPGGASMLSQHQSGHRPISLEAAKAYARGLGISIGEIAPRFAKLVSDVSELAQPAAATRVAESARPPQAC